jgi:hypothetical protein
MKTWNQYVFESKEKTLEQLMSEFEKEINLKSPDSLKLSTIEFHIADAAKNENVAQSEIEKNQKRIRKEVFDNTVKLIEKEFSKSFVDMSKIINLRQNLFITGSKIMSHEEIEKMILDDKSKRREKFETAHRKFLIKQDINKLKEIANDKHIKYAVNQRLSPEKEKENLIDIIIKNTPFFV